MGGDDSRITFQHPRSPKGTSSNEQAADFLCFIALLIACDANASKEPIVVVPPTTNTPNPVNGANGSNGSAGDAGVNGSNGANGQNGTPGPQGAPGTNGIDNHIAKSWSCNTTLSVSPCAASFVPYWQTCSVQVWYYSSQTNFGDTTVRIGIDALNQGHQSMDIWPSADFNAQNGYSAMRSDLYGTTTNGNGVWETWLNKNNNSLRIRYTDSEMSGVGYEEWNFGCQQFNW